MHSYFVPGIVHFMAFPAAGTGAVPVLDSLRAIADDDFFGSIEVTWIHDPKERAEAAALLKSSGLVVGFGAHPVLLSQRLDLNSLDEAERLRAVQAVLEVVPQARELGAVGLALLSGKDKPEDRRGEAFELLYDSLLKIGRACAAEGMSLALEVFDRTVDKKALVGSTAEAARLARELRRDLPDFGILLDHSHLPLQFEKTRAAVQTAGDTLVWAHYGNCLLKEGHALYGDQHPRIGHPDGVNGVPELREYLAALLEAGYLGPGSRNVLACEVKPAVGEDSRTLIAQTKRSLRSAWAGLTASGGAA